MSEMTGVVDQQQQQYVAAGGPAVDKLLHCKDCGMNFDSQCSLETHLRYHHENLLNQWASQQQQQQQQEESNNNNSKAGNHNSGGLPAGAKSSTADSSESRPPSEQPAQLQAAYNQHYPQQMYSETQFFMASEAAAPYLMPPAQHYSPDRDDEVGPSRAQTGYSRFHPYQPQQRSVGSSSPRSPLQCDKCGAVCDSPAALTEHVRSGHPSSPNSAYAPPQAPPAQYQQLAAGSPQQPAAREQAQPTSQHPAYDFGGVKSEMKQEAEEQAEILDLDSHKVQTHRYEEEFMRHQQEMQHMQMQQQQHHHHHHQVIHQQGGSHGRPPAHSVTSMLSWPPASQPTHDYHHSQVSPIQEQQSQFMRGQQQQQQQQQQMSPVEPPPPLTSSQPLPNAHPMPPAALMQQNPKPPPISGNQSWKSNEARRPKTYNCTACNKWFTSSGHLKRHYNTTLHKNAVKQSNLPDPAGMPISVHHHPAREATSSRGGSVRRDSPELSSSSSPPNLMAGPSGEATRGLLHKPTNINNSSSAIFSSSNNNSNSSNSSNNSNEASPVQQPPPPSGSMGILAYLGSPPGHHHLQHQMGSPQQQQQQHHHHHHHHHHLPMGSPSQIGHPHHSPMHHMSSPSPMGSSQQQHQHQHHHQQQQQQPQQHHMSSPSPIMGGVAASPPNMMMGGTSMPHQPYPNALPPHVTTITSIPGPRKSITSQLTTTGSHESSSETSPVDSEHEDRHMLPAFGTFATSQKMAEYAQYSLANGYIVGQRNQPQAVNNVGGLSPEEAAQPPDESKQHYELTPVSGYELYREEEQSPPRYERPVIADAYPLQIKQEEMPEHQKEANNNELVAKEELNPNIMVSSSSSKKLRVGKSGAKRTNAKQRAKEQQVTGTNPHFISRDGLYQCIECKKTFNKVCYLTQHNKSFHSGDKPFKCSQCGKRFPLEHLHAEHLQKHAGEKPYKCEICPKQFNHKTDLRRHLCLHTGEKPYACENCGKGFIRKDHMMKHVETHRKKANAQQHRLQHLRA